MYKAVLYLVLFLVILGVVAFGFFTMTNPHIEQESVTKELDPKDAFKIPTSSTPQTLIQVPAAPAPTAQQAPETGATE